MNKKLYRVTLRGMKTATTGTAYGIPYVVAETATEAVEKVQDYLNKKSLGYSKEREMESIELLAEECDYPACQIQLFL